MGRGRLSTTDDPGESEQLRADQLDSRAKFRSRLLSPLGESFRVGEVRPEYVVISNTWGRWMLKTRDEDTVIHSGYWKVPANKRSGRDGLNSAVEVIAKRSHT